MPNSAQEGVHVARMEVSPEKAIERVSAAAQSWGGEWQNDGALAGKLILPVSAGVRRGWIGFEVSAQGGESDETPEGESGSRLELRQAQEHLHVDRATVAVLVTSLLGALLFLIVPFVHRLLPLLPVGFILTVAGWLFVVARLRNSGPEEFLEQVRETVPEPEGAP